jgi:hypothetical protein
MKRSARCLVIALTFSSWIAISNHCAFAAVATKSRPSQSECPFHSKPAKPQPHAAIQCCKVLRAVVPTVAKNWARNDADFSDVDLYFEEFATVATCHRSLSPLVLDTGPPGARTFAELILQRSLFAHAPPFLG